MTTFDHVRDAISAGIESFKANRAIEAVKRRTYSPQNYTALLLSLYHQTLEAPSSFALAGVNCRLEHRDASEFLMKHAEEEMLHYRWIEDDLNAVGYAGEPVSAMTPPKESLAYVSFNFYIAHRKPLARIAIAGFLEGAAARLGPVYGPRLIESTKLSSNAFTFLSSHTITDAGHSAEIMDILAKLQCSPDDWRWMARAVQTASHLYKAIYEASLDG